MELDGGIFGGEAWHIDLGLDGVTAQDENKNIVGHHCWNDGEIGSEETEDDVGDKLVHSIDSGRFSYRINRFVS
jgi:hypothetical protein